MGQRLNVEICYGDAVLANCYYHWDGYTFSSLAHAISIIEKFGALGGGGIRDKKFAVDLLRRNSEGFDALEKARCRGKKLDFELNDAVSRNEGLIAITEEGIEETRRFEEARITIDILNKMINAEGCFWVDLKDESTWFDEDDLGVTIEVDIDPSGIPFKDAQKFYRNLQHADNDGATGITYPGEPKLVYWFIA